MYEISIIIPTIEGREEYLRNCLSSYAAYTKNYETIILVDRPTCGIAWIEGVESSSGQYLHFSADDLCCHDGWWQAAYEVVQRNFLPAPRILNDDGSLQSCGGTNGWNAEHPTGEEADFSRIPFLSRKQWDKIAPLVRDFLRDAHYYTDNAVSFAGRIAGFRTGIHRSYLFTHSLAEAGRGAGMTWDERMWKDYQKFLQWQNNLATMTT